MINPNNMLRSLRNYIVEHLEKTEIFEMAFNRERFVRTCENIAKPLVQHLFIFLFARSENISRHNWDHWFEEIVEYVEKIHEITCTVSKKKSLSKCSK